MLTGALPTVFVSDMDRAVAFYTERGVEFGELSNDGCEQPAWGSDA